MMRLAAPAAEQAWACTIAAPVASPAPCYEARLPAGSSNGQKPRYGFALLYLLLSGSAGLEEHCTQWTNVTTIWHLREVDLRI